MELETNKLYYFNVIEKGVNNLGKNFCILEDIYSNTHYYPKNIDADRIGLYVIGSFKHKEGEKKRYRFAEIKEEKTNFSKLNHFEIGKIYPFKFVRIEVDSEDENNAANCKMLLHDLNYPKSEYVTKPFEWQLDGTNCSEIIFCEVCTSENKRIFLRQSIKNLTHPIYDKGKEYDFEIDFGSDDKSNPFVYAKGIDNQVYKLVRPFSDENQLNRVKYVFNGFNTNGTLLFRQFVPFEKIVKYRALKRLTYTKFRDIQNNPIISKMFEDYDNKENLWIISFCNILEEEFDKSIDALEYEQALIYVEVLVEFENWIINSGFLNSFRDSTVTLENAKFKLSGFENKKNALEVILNDEAHNKIIESTTKKSIDLNFLKLISELLILTHNYVIVPIDDIIRLINNLGEQEVFKKHVESGLILSYVQKYCSEKERKIFEPIFTNADKRDRYFVGNTELKDLIKLNFALILIYKDRQNSNYLNLYLSKHFRYESLHSSSKTNRLNLIQLSLAIALNPESLNIYNLDLCWQKFNNLPKMEYKLLSKKTLLKPSTLISDYQTKTQIKTNILDENPLGYLVKIHGNDAILPKKALWESFFQNINYNPEREIFVTIQHIDEQFGNIVVASANLKTPIDFENKNVIEVNSFVTGYVKRIEDYGAFINLGEVDGLLHNSKMGYYSTLLNLGQKLNLKIESITQEGEKTLISLAHFDDLKQITLKSKHKGVISKIYDYGVFVTISAEISGLVRKENISFQETFTCNHLREKDIVDIQLININKEGKLEFSIKSIEANPFVMKKEFLFKTFQGYIIQISPLLITVKFRNHQLIGFHTLPFNNEFQHNLEVNDLVYFNVCSINTENESIQINIDFTNIYKAQLSTVSDTLSLRVALEIGTCYEHFAYLMSKNNEKLNYLSIAKTFYGIASSAKSYYLNIFINYQRIINEMSVTKNDISNFENILKTTIYNANELILEIKEQNLTVQIFPAIVVVQKTLEILTCFGNNQKDNMTFLFAISTLENYDFDIIEKTARLVLAYNLISHDLVDENLKIQRWKQLQQYLKEGLLIVENEDEQDIKKRTELYKLIEEGENDKIEFKASLLKPVHDEAMREILLGLQQDLQIAIENNDLKKIEILKAKIEDKQNQGSIKGVKHTAMKNLVAFANTQGGNLIIGLEDNLNILGIEYEMNLSTFTLKDQDTYLNSLDTLIDSYIGNDFHQCIEFTEFIKTENGHLLWIKIKKSNKPIFLRLDKNGSSKKDFFIRGRVSSRILDIEEFTSYFSGNFML